MKKKTLIIKESVLSAIMIITKYSNGGDVTSLHTLYLNEFLSLGIYREIGFALMEKSMHCFYTKILYTLAIVFNSFYI